MEKLIFKLSLFLVITVTLTICTSPEGCAKYFCRNATYKNGEAYYGYFGGVVFPNTLLDTPLLENTTAINDKDCVKRCLHKEGCFSMNAGPVQRLIDERGRTIKYVECHLLSDTAFSKSVVFVNITNWVHISAQHSGCSKFPCKNGGRCIPDYTTDTYECECEMEYWGRYCEQARPYAVGGTAPEDAYCHNPFNYRGVDHRDCITDDPMPDGTNLPWCGTDESTNGYGVCSYTRLLPVWQFLFDDESTTVENTGTKSLTVATVVHGTAKEVYVPDRIGKVLYSDGSGLIPGVTAGTAGNIFDIYMQKEVHELGQTLMFWVKISRKNKEPLCTLSYQDQTGWGIQYNHTIGKWMFVVRSMTKQAKAFTNPTNPYVWTHLAASYINTYNGSVVEFGTLKLYVNGVFQSFGETYRHGLPLTGAAEPFGLFSPNVASTPPCILWGDDYMFFDIELSDENIQELYEMGKMVLL